MLNKLKKKNKLLYQKNIEYKNKKEHRSIKEKCKENLLYVIKN